MSKAVTKRDAGICFYQLNFMHFLPLTHSPHPATAAATRDFDAIAAPRFLWVFALSTAHTAHTAS